MSCDVGNNDDSQCLTAVFGFISCVKAGLSGSADSGWLGGAVGTAGCTGCTGVETFGLGSGLSVMRFFSPVFDVALSFGRVWLVLYPVLS